MLFFKRLNSALKDFRKQLAKYTQKAGVSPGTHVSPFPATSLKLINEESDTFSFSGSSCSSHTTEAGATPRDEAPAISGSSKKQSKSTLAAAPSAHSEGSREETGGSRGNWVNGENMRVKKSQVQARNAGTSVVPKRDVSQFRSDAFPKKGGSGSGKNSDGRSGHSEGESMGLETGIIKVVKTGSPRRSKSHDAAGIRGLLNGEGDEEKKTGKLAKLFKRCVCTRPFCAAAPRAFRIDLGTNFGLNYLILSRLPASKHPSRTLNPKP